MATILQFAERLAEHGDWTPAERSQLRDMSTQLGHTTAGLDLVFGKTEEGDPWCVVADDRSEVLLHVARIQGNFVVHAPRNDQVIESHDLWLAVSRVLGGVLRDRRGVVLPFAPGMMGQPTALALMLAAAVRGDFTEIVTNALPALPAHNDRAETAPALPVQAHGDAQEARHAAALGAGEAPRPVDHHPANTAGAAVAALTVVAANAADAAAIGAGASAQAQAGQAPAPRAVSDAGQAPPAASQTANLALAAPPNPNGAGAATAGGGAGGAVVSGEDKGGHGGAGFAAGSPNAETGASGGPGAATVGGGVSVSGDGGDNAAGAGLETGAGAGTPTAPAAAENAVVVSSGAVARGQMGTADVFVLTAPVRTEGSNVISLGVVAGFSLAEGDRLVFANGAVPTVVQVIELNPLSASASGLGPDTARRISYDFNGDGREDGYVLVVDAPQPLTLHKAADIGVAELSPLAEHAVSLQGVAAPAAAASITVFFIGQ